ncbi:hypothetical protein V499_03698 [Pseudogymnoascus sp. VKM F-103]|uniref:Uncharacterized protein n=1 Tax=Pseudogymnoascus verrucosus TaxID=342668 RepID=A0A1B8GUZ4_9PEZI|nr:uncharacterized protein VE01_02144 [Pseudogymnoascus verrucosus]KFY76731.1 hypothetical protein V499_03698 [Pseudogymnoascus sp. VKM F-103]OBT99661.1 hypothetical protein VE01_02144 [Pseudogymnoascus verrucosus]
MVIPGVTPVPSFPKNRRRMRRGARKRHALSRKVDPRDEYLEGAFLAHDTAFLPLSGPFPGGAQPQSLERSWLAWMAHEVRREEEDEQCRLFGGDADDDALRALGILYDSIRDDGEKKSEAPTLESGVFTAGVNNEDTKDGDKDEAKDKDVNFPPLPYRLYNVLSKPAKLSKTMRRHNSRRSPLTIPTPPLLSSYLMDDSEILRLTTLQSPQEPAEKETQTLQHQSLPTTHASFPTQFPVPLHTPGATDGTDKPTATLITTTKLADPSWTFIPQDPDWVLLDDDS